MIKILNAESENYCEPARQILQSVGALTEESLTRQELINQIKDFDVLIVRLANQIDAEVLQHAKRLKAIVTATTGLDHIDMKVAEAQQITVLSLRGEAEFLRSVYATAEHTWALLLALLRHIPAAFDHVLEGHWNRDLYRGHELFERRLGIIGLGRIGEKIARYGHVFGMHVQSYDPYRTPWIEDVERIDSLDKLLKTSNIVTLHVPLNDETFHMIGSSELSKMSRNAYLVNTSRGDVVDEIALVRALETSAIAGAALDVISHERDVDNRKQNLLLKYAQTHNNLLITPHIAGATYESMANTEIFMARKLQHFINTRFMTNEFTR